MLDIFLQLAINILTETLSFKEETKTIQIVKKFNTTINLLNSFDLVDELLYLGTMH